MREAESKISIKFFKIPSHSGLFGKDLADYYARKGAEVVNLPIEKKNFIFSAEQVNNFAGSNIILERGVSRCY